MTVAAFPPVAGIRRISEVNLWVSGVLLASFLVLGPTSYLVELLMSTLVDYLRGMLLSIPGAVG